MKYFIYSIICIVTFAACSAPYTKSEHGNEYRTAVHGNGQQLAYNYFIEYQIAQEYKGTGRGENKDTVMHNSRNEMAIFEKYDTLSRIYVFKDMLNNARAGDSIVIRILADSMYRDLSLLPKYMYKGGYIYTTIKIVNVFTTRAEADSVNRAEYAVNAPRIYNNRLVEFEKNIKKDSAQIAIDSKTIKDYLDKNNIKYIIGKWGTFVAIHDEGKGEKINEKDVVGINYTGRTLDSGKVFDSNIDPAFNNIGSFEMIMSRLGSALSGWSDALFLLRNGAKATIYIPSSLAFGKKAFPPYIKKNENIIYDLEITNVITELDAMRIISERRIKEDAASTKMAKDSAKRNIPIFKSSN